MSSINSTSPYRVQGPVTKIADIAKQKPGLVTAATAEQIQELQSRGGQRQEHQALAPAAVEVNALPQFTARSPNQMALEMDWAWMRSRMVGDTKE
nr:hypothetical protein [uncultured Massilia sp.]